MRIAIIGGLNYKNRKEQVQGEIHAPEEFADIYLERFLKRVAKYHQIDLIAVTGNLTADNSMVDEYRKLEQKLINTTLPVIVAQGENDPINSSQFSDTFNLENGKSLKVQSYNNDSTSDITIVGGAPGEKLQLDAFDDSWLIRVPPCCGTKLSYTILEITDSFDCKAEEFDLKMERSLALYDYHIHSPRAYCAEDLTPDGTAFLMNQFGLAGGVVVEHSGQLYYGLREYWSSRYNINYPDNIQINDEAVAAIIFARHQSSLPDGIDLRRGIELDVERNGNIITTPELLAQCPVRLGAIHAFDNTSDSKLAAKEFLIRLNGLCSNKIDILAHPFRVFHKRRIPFSLDLMSETVKILKAHSVAAEINYHANNQPEIEFFTMCINSGVKIAFGSDTHASYEIGEFYPHWELVKRLGIAHEHDKYFFSLK